MKYVCIVSGPSTVGKSKVIKHLCEKYDFYRIVSTATRKARKEEVNEKDYRFITLEQFNEWQISGEFFSVEKNSFGEYGYLKKDIESGLESKRIPVMDMSTTSYLKYRDQSPFQIVSFFLHPPSFHDIELRLRSRGKERGIYSEEDIIERIKFSKNEIRNAKYYDKNIRNVDIDVTCHVLINYMKNYIKDCGRKDNEYE